MTKSIVGVCPVLAVPFTSEGEVDYDSFASLVEWIISLKTKSVLFFGVASENIKLSDPERISLLEILLELRKGTPLQVITTVADHSSELAVKRAKEYQSMGVDFINVLPPTFFNPTADQIRAHISRILEAVHLPVIVQHLPQAGGMSDVGELMPLSDEYSNFQIVKCEANPPSESIRRVAALSNGRVKTLIGWGGIFWREGQAAGAQGIQPGCGLTDLYHWAERALVEGEVAEFEKRLDRFLPSVTYLIENLDRLIQAEKHILFRRGIITTDYCRNPTIELDTRSLTEIRKVLDLVEEVRTNV